VAISNVQFAAIVEHLRKVAPPARGTSVKVRRGRCVETQRGHTTKKGRQFHVLIDSRLGYAATEETMIHEWAHVRSWRPHHPLSGDHDAVWGVCYAEVYCLYHGVK